MPQANRFPADPSLPKGNGQLVLVVDDEASIRDITRATLEKFDYRVITANDGESGLLAFQENKDKLAVVLTDMAMPKMDGAALIEHIRQESDIPIIAMSGLAIPGRSSKLQSMAISGQLQKPFTAELLLTKLAELFKEN